MPPPNRPGQPPQQDDPQARLNQLNLQIAQIQAMPTDEAFAAVQAAQAISFADQQAQQAEQFHTQETNAATQRASAIAALPALQAQAVTLQASITPVEAPAPS